MTTPAADPIIGTTIDKRYLIEARIARGGMASVYRGLDYRLDRPVAVKIMHPHLAEDDAFTRRFIQEARQAARLAHPNIVNVFDQGQDGALTFIVMEYLPGITLRELLQDFGVLTWEQTLDVAKAILQGLTTAHKAGIVHRDLKPENILMADDGRIKIADFGLARAASHNTQTGQALLGTVAYLSPELVTGSPADIRSDLYALGIMMFEMLTGRQPFTGDQAVTIAYQHANDQVPQPSSVNSDVPTELDDIVTWATKRTPDERPPHARAMLDQIIRAQSEIKKHFSSAEPTQMMPSAPPLDEESVGPEHLTQKMPREIPPEDEHPTDVLDAPEQLFSDLEMPDYAEGANPQTVATGEVATVKRRPGWGLWLSFFLAAIAAIAVAVWLLTPRGPVIVTVPQVTGQTVAQAGEVLRADGFILNDSIEQRYDDDVPSGLVVATTPEAGSEVEEQSEVTLIISQGVEPAALPAVIGLDLEQARERLTDARLTIGQTRQQYSQTTPRGDVIEVLDNATVTIAPGTQLEAGTEVNLTVSAGSLPEVAGLSVEQAEAALDEAGLLGVVGGDGEFSDTIAQGQVIRFETPSGEQLTPGDTVTLTISRGPPLITVPNVIGQTIAEAKSALEERGFAVEVRSNFTEDVWADENVTVTSVEPTEGQQVPIGTTVILRSFF